MMQTISNYTSSTGKIKQNSNSIKILGITWMKASSWFSSSSENLLQSYLPMRLFSPWYWWAWLCLKRSVPFLPVLLVPISSRRWHYLRSRAWHRRNVLRQLLNLSTSIRKLHNYRWHRDRQRVNELVRWASHHWVRGLLKYRGRCGHVGRPNHQTNSW